MYLACILHVSRMSPSYQIHLSLDAFEIHVSHHVSWMYPACIFVITLADTCISHVSRMYPASQIRTSLDMYSLRIERRACAARSPRLKSEILSQTVVCGSRFSDQQQEAQAATEPTTSKQTRQQHVSFSVHVVCCFSSVPLLRPGDGGGGGSGAGSGAGFGRM